MAERFVATSSRGEHVVQTGSYQTAVEYAVLLRGEVIDMEAS